MKLKELKDQGCDSYLYRNTVWKVLAVFIFILVSVAYPSKADASTVTPSAIGKVGVVVDYLEETATVTTGSSINTKFYVSKDNKNWETMSSNVLDISALLQAKEVTLYFKGNKDTTVSDVKLSGEDASLKAVYNVIGGEGRILLSGAPLPIEVRKGANGQWKAMTNNFLITTPYETYGATLYFRTTGSAIKRPGKIVSVKVPKRPNGPSVKFDGSKLYISGLKPGETQYRVGDATDWALFPASSTLKTMDLKGLTGFELSTGGTIEFRTGHNDSKKKVASSVKIIEIPPQPLEPGNITINGTTLTAVDPNKKKYYEYTLVKSTGTLDMKTAKWSSFTSAKPVVVKNAGVGDKIYVRAKSYTDSAAKLVVPASVHKEIVVQTVTPGK